jgi:hypothetical protein
MLDEYGRHAMPWGGGPLQLGSLRWLCDVNICQPRDMLRPASVRHQGRWRDYEQNWHCLSPAWLLSVDDIYLLFLKKDRVYLSSITASRYFI